MKVLEIFFTLYEWMLLLGVGVNRSPRAESVTSLLPPPKRCLREDPVSVVGDDRGLVTALDEVLVERLERKIVHLKILRVNNLKNNLYLPHIY